MEVKILEGGHQSVPLYRFIVIPPAQRYDYKIVNAAVRIIENHQMLYFYQQFPDFMNEVITCITLLQLGIPIEATDEDNEAPFDLDQQSEGSFSEISQESYESSSDDEDGPFYGFCPDEEMMNDKRISGQEPKNHTYRH